MRTRLLAAAVAALTCACAPASAAADGAAAAARAAARGPAVRLTAGFPRGALLGAETPVRLGLRIDPRRRPSPVRELRVRFPASLGIATSGLGTESCARPASDFVAVMILGGGLAGCSRNAVMGRGTARAEVRLGGSDRAGSLVIPELARVSMLAAPFERERFGLLFIANGLRPFGVTLAFRGVIESAPRPYGGALLLNVPPVPNRFDADVALTAIAFEIGARDIRYRRGRGARATLYRPEGIVLPERCPRDAFPFHAQLTFADGSAAEAAATIPCPPPPRTP